MKSAEITDQWIWLWFHHLQANRDYERYCAANRAGDTATVAVLENEHEKIKDVFADFGDVHAFEMLSPSKKRFSDGWFQWLDAHRPLFYPTTITVGPKTTTTPPKYSLALQRAGDAQMKTMRKRLTAWTVLGPLTGKPVRKFVRSKNRIEEITKTAFIKLVTQQKPLLWQNGKDWDDWSWAVIQRRGNQDSYKRQIIKLVNDAQAIIDNTIRGVFPVL